MSRRQNTVCPYNITLPSRVIQAVLASVYRVVFIQPLTLLIISLWKIDEPTR